MEVFGCGDEVVDAEYAEVDPTGRYMRVSSLSINPCLTLSCHGFVLHFRSVRCECDIVI